MEHNLQGFYFLEEKWTCCTISYLSNHTYNGITYVCDNIDFTSIFVYFKSIIIVYDYNFCVYMLNQSGIDTEGSELDDLLLNVEYWQPDGFSYGSFKDLMKSWQSDHWLECFCT